MAAVSVKTSIVSTHTNENGREKHIKNKDNSTWLAELSLCWRRVCDIWAAHAKGPLTSQDSLLPSYVYFVFWYTCIKLTLFLIGRLQKNVIATSVAIEILDLPLEVELKKTLK